VRAILETLSEAQTAELGRRLAAVLCPNDVVTLSGDLGAGKTAFVKGVAAGLGVEEPVVSPTFNILLVHPGRLTLFHVDLYRLDTAPQLEDIDFFGTLESGGVTFVEWGERFPEALPPDHLALVLEITGDDERRIIVAPVGPRSEALATAWVESCPSTAGGGPA
jgi:tRNA threonylcarbamoyladenosine biosynthesis protein TsaE